MHNLYKQNKKKMGPLAKEEMSFNVFFFFLFLALVELF